MNKYPFPVSDDINFRCIGCGKCCDSAPQLSIAEAIRLADDFPLLASVVSMRSDHNIPGWKGELVEMTRRRSEELGALQTEATSSNWQTVKFATTLSAVAIQPPSTQRCSALQTDGRCGIYDRRPNVCRYVPAQHLAPKTNQQLALAIFKEKHNQDCDWSPSAPVLLADGTLVNPEMSASFTRAEQDDLRDAALLRALVDAETAFTSDSEEFDILDILESAMASEDGETRFPFAFLALLLEDLEEAGSLPDGYPPFSVEDIARKQAAVCQRMIAENLKRKDSRDREATAQLRHLLSETNVVLRSIEERSA